MKTLLLSLDLWDLVADASGNIAVATPPYSLAQDVASACRTFLGECWYDDTLGVPYFQKILGKIPPISFFQASLAAAALTAVPPTADVFVKSAQCIVQSFNLATREVIGQVQFIDSNGNPGTVQL